MLDGEVDGGLQDAEEASAEELGDEVEALLDEGEFELGEDEEDAEEEEVEGLEDVVGAGHFELHVEEAVDGGAHDEASADDGDYLGGQPESALVHRWLYKCINPMPNSINL